MLSQTEAIGAATASDGGLAPIASFWVRIMTSCINIKRGVLYLMKSHVWKSRYLSLSLLLKKGDQFNVHLDIH